jgi:hypothetical protein
MIPDSDRQQPRKPAAVNWPTVGGTSGGDRLLTVPGCANSRDSRVYAQPSPLVSGSAPD